MFLNTLGIKRGVVDAALKKRTSGITTELDKGGKCGKKHIPHQAVQENVKKYIESLPVVFSH